MEIRKLNFNNHAWQLNIQDQADESVVAEIFKWREYKIADEVISKSKVLIVDVGAHRGFFTIYCRSLNSQVPVIAVEPEIQNIKALKKHLLVNNITNVEIIEAGLAATSGERWLKRSSDSHNHVLALREEELKSIEKVMVKTLTLESVAKDYSEISLLKMDIEGGEYEIFESMNDMVYEKIRSIIMEYHNIKERNYQIIEKLLREHGFGVQIFPSRFDKTMGFLWATNKRKDTSV